MAAEQSPVLILTINDCPGMRVVRVIGPVNALVSDPAISSAISLAVCALSSVGNRLGISK